MPLHLFARLPRVSFIREEVRGTLPALEKAVKKENDKFVICMKSKMDLMHRSRITYLILAFLSRATLLN